MFSFLVGAVKNRLLSESYNGSLSNPYTLTNNPISVAPSDVAISERTGRFEIFLGVAIIVVAFVEIGLRYIDRKK